MDFWTFLLKKLKKKSTLSGFSCVIVQLSHVLPFTAVAFACVILANKNKRTKQKNMFKLEFWTVIYYVIARDAVCFILLWEMQITFTIKLKHLYFSSFNLSDTNKNQHSFLS